MGRAVRFASLWLFVCSFFSPALLADGVHSFSYHASSIFDDSTRFTEVTSAAISGHAVFFVLRTTGPDEDHVNWLEDLHHDHGKAWGWRNRYHHTGSGGSFGVQDNEGTDGNSGSTGSTGVSGASTVAVPEPSVFVLLSTALAAFLLKSLRRATA